MIRKRVLIKNLDMKLRQQLIGYYLIAQDTELSVRMRMMALELTKNIVEKLIEDEKD